MVNRLTQRVRNAPPGVRRAGRWALDIGLILAGGTLMAVAIDVFLDPNNVVPGGFTAVSMFANRLWGWPVGVTLLVLNVPFLAVGMAVLGAEFGPKTIFAAVFSSLAIDLLKPYLPVVQGEPLLYLAYGSLLYGLGMGLVFRTNATSGGTEIPAKLIQHFYHVRMSQSLMMMDIVILGLAALFFGLTPALYALIAAWAMNRVVDLMELGVNASDTAFILTTQPGPIRDGIIERLERGVTFIPAEGGFTGEPRTILFTVVSRRQAGALRAIVSAADPGAFLVISPGNEVLGVGFKPLTRARG
jgi:uncharacterized membrane-anchored protein YitT (DUF2179 family)